MVESHADSTVPVTTPHRAGGVTLVELLVVVAILALLTATLLPSLAVARQKARRLRCANGLHAVGQALNFYKTGLGRYPSPGDRDPVRFFGFNWKPGDAVTFRPVSRLDDVADLADALVSSSLGDPRAFYCPSSLDSDPCAPKPYVRQGWTSQPIPTWRAGYISYIYLVGLDYRRPAAHFPDANGRPTFNPAVESPERRMNRVNPRTVLMGDRTVELVPPNRNIAGSNHGREGGWFLFTSGDVQWWNWERLTAHPTKIYTWYWPRVSSNSRGPSAGGHDHFVPTGAANHPRFP